MAIVAQAAAFQSISEPVSSSRRAAGGKAGVMLRGCGGAVGNARTSEVAASSETVTLDRGAIQDSDLSAERLLVGEHARRLRPAFQDAGALEAQHAEPELGAGRAIQERARERHGGEEVLAIQPPRRSGPAPNRLV